MGFQATYFKILVARYTRKDKSGDLLQTAGEYYTTWVLLCLRLKTSPSNCLGITA